jgi:NAD(P)-dependent dehydrogenase (short-subunit alcohol dehydrogenase family)
MVCIDVEDNSWLRRQCQYTFLRFDLNPLRRQGGIQEFSKDLREQLASRLEEAGATGISALVQGAGVYWSGSLASSTAEIRERVLGVNYVSRIELLYAVLQINHSRGTDSQANLTHIDIGSLQGLRAREFRSLYASSKAAGVDFSASIAAGNEIARAIYFAPGPIDTYMLHYNHWVVRAGGPSDFIAKLKGGDRGQYEAVFVDCSDDAFEAALRQLDLPKTLRDSFAAYKGFRREALNGEAGILTAQECATVVHAFLKSPSLYPSGVYAAYRSGERVLTAFRRYEQLTRTSWFLPTG